ncbi:heme-thiolate peroxidase [Auricularia subglabra TFB-10046 SS5]|nr:heme-thiolate peroxidase [Auricularia subglabra TFB-10046 SS5]
MHLTPALATLLAVTHALAAATGLQPYDSLAGLSNVEIEAFARAVSVPIVGGQPLPPPITDTGAKLVHDEVHPWMPLSDGDQRGPCPGLNALASHGYLPRTGVASPGEIITAVQEGFNMGFDIAVFVTYAAFLVNGNQLTNLMSIGGLSRLTGPPPALPALAGGLNVHGTFEGDASLTRSDAFLGDNHSFNETLFDQLVETSKQFGGGRYNLSAAGEFRFRRIQDSIARNPTFRFSNPRVSTAYAESVFPFAYFIDGRLVGDDVRAAQGLDLGVMRGFFEDARMPPGFVRREGAFGLGAVGDASDLVRALHPVRPGFNNGTTDSYVEDKDFMGGETSSRCALYRKFVNTTVELYPNPAGQLRDALNVNLKNFFIPAASGENCVPSNPYP